MESKCAKEASKGTHPAATGTVKAVKLAKVHVDREVSERKSTAAVEKKSTTAEEKPTLSRRKVKDENYQKMKKYISTSEPLQSKTIQDRKIKGNLRRSEKKQMEQAYKLAQSEWLLTEEPGYLEPEEMERTYKLTQEALKSLLDHDVQEKQFDLKLDHLGPYSLDYTRNGRHLLIGGRKGHIGAFDWKTGNLSCEIQLGETVRDVKWLHNETMFAVAQKSHVNIYDNTGIELHCLTKHIEVNKLEFLPFHWLLASIGNAGYLKYQDTSTGKLVVELRTGLGRCDTMIQNPQNAILHLGHSNGNVSLWSPNTSQPIVKMWCHRGPVQAISVDGAGNYMVTAGLDGQMKIWDVRTYKSLYEYYTPTPAKTIDISQTGLIAVGYGPHIAVWKDAFKTKAQSPYMTHLHPSSLIHDVHFCPFEDVLGYGHTGGMSSIIIPGSGNAHYNILEVNPNETKKQRRDGEVHSLMEKIQPEMITLNPDDLGKLIKTTQEFQSSSLKKEVEANTGQTFVPKFKKRGKSASMRKYLRKNQNVIDGKREELKDKLAKEKKQKEIERKKATGEYEEPSYSALDRFTKKAKV